MRHRENVCGVPVGPAAGRARRLVALVLAALLCGAVADTDTSEAATLLVESGYLNGVPYACAQAIVSQAGSVVASIVAGNFFDSVAFSDSTCAACGKARAHTHTHTHISARVSRETRRLLRLGAAPTGPLSLAQANYCVLDFNSHSTLPPALFDCVSGGTTDGAVTFCKSTAGAGLIALLVIVPSFIIAACVTACCFCCACCPVYKRRHPEKQPVVLMMQPGVVVAGGAVAAPASPADVAASNKV